MAPKSLHYQHIRRITQRSLFVFTIAITLLFLTVGSYYWTDSVTHSSRRRFLRYQSDLDTLQKFHRSRKLMELVVPKSKPQLKCQHNETENGDDTSFPPDIFSFEQRKKGAITLHFIGLAYMFIALSIVCDEYFVPSLYVIIEKLGISEDVAGATFMAAGGSAPEFFTSVFGLFLTRNNVGIGTIVGSATFNILCVLSFCALFSHEVLSLTWWPLFRDVSFYIIALLFLLTFFLDELIDWHEALAMFLIYIIYCIVMKYNDQIECFVKMKLLRKIHPLNQVANETTNVHGSASMCSCSHFRGRISSILQNDGKELDRKSPANGRKLREQESSADGAKLNQQTESFPADSKRATRPIWHSNDCIVLSQVPGSVNQADDKLPGLVTENVNDILSKRVSFEMASKSNENLDLDGDEPVDISWPKTLKSQIIYIVIAPVLLPLYFTLPDTKKAESKPYYLWAFVGSIVWIAIYSYLMVWWANVIGETLGINNEIMGLTVLAAGTSIPDLITSVIVARKGFGDMAVSSSIGSNLFDICVGLPIPWLLHFILLAFKSSMESVSVSSKGMICSVGMLLIMLIALICSIAISRWRMSRLFGIVMIISYLVTVVIGVLLELDYLNCPLRISDCT